MQKGNFRKKSHFQIHRLKVALATPFSSWGAAAIVGNIQGGRGCTFSDYITFHPYHYIDILPHRKLLIILKIDED